jgi:hypothetical protein
MPFDFINCPSTLPLTIIFKGTQIYKQATLSHPSTPHSRTFRQLALGAVIGPVLFTLAWIVLGILQPPTRDMYGVMGGISGAISNPISGLGVGPEAQLFNAAFVLCGFLTLAGVVGVFQTLGTNRPISSLISMILMVLSPLGLEMAGVYTLAISIPLHMLAAALLFLTPVVSFIVAGLCFRSIPDWRRFGTWLMIGSPLTLLLFVLYAMSFNQAGVAAGEGVAGLTERIMMLEVSAWYVAMGWKAFRRLG